MYDSRIHNFCSLGTCQVLDCIKMQWPLVTRSAKTNCVCTNWIFIDIFCSRKDVILFFKLKKILQDEVICVSNKLWYHKVEEMWQFLCTADLYRPCNIYLAVLEIFYIT